MSDAHFSRHRMADYRVQYLPTSDTDGLINFHSDQLTASICFRSPWARADSLDRCLRATKSDSA